jgi:radical SAM superfamily enzyme YgiQ (UPF0313 family)
MKKLLFLQVSSVLIHDAGHRRASRYYEDLYRLKDGYEKNNHFWELPLWVVEIDGYLDGIMETSFRLIDNYEPLEDVDDFDYILFSITDANKGHVRNFAQRYQGRAEILYGGYTRIEGLKYFDSPKALAEYLDVPYKYALNYKHFKGTHTIPRITLSTGCRSNCKFCVTQHWLELTPSENILHQAEQMARDLEFKFAYVADSTFGQAPNHTILQEAHEIIKRYNPKFEGFIIQTTAGQLNKPGFIETLQGLGVRVVEIGMESYNDRILKSLNKPASEKMIRNAVTRLHEHGLKIILNVITGLVGETLETYLHTLEFIEDHQDMLYALNIYTLAVYSDKEYGKDINARPLNGSDTARYFYNTIFELGTEILHIDTIV